MADWLCRSPRPVVDEMVICDPRRNKLIYQGGDKTNRIDAKKLAELAQAGLIRSVTFLAYMDTPWRFAGRKKVWRYCGVGLRRFASGTDKWGREKAGSLRLAWAVNKRLKNVVMGATMSAINQGDNVIAQGYKERIARGMSSGNARHTAARKQLDRMMAIWKTGSEYSPDLA